MTALDKPLQNFHRILCESLVRRDPGSVARPFTVAEIYQDLVPYRSHRDRLGIEMNGDYEHVLLRLLSGEGGFLRMDSDAALAEIREELKSSNPNTGLYRDYAAVEVALESGHVPGDLDLGDPDQEADAEGVEEDVDEPLLEGRDDARGRPDGEAAGVGRTCRWCEGELPARPDVRFCPHCGMDVQVVPCPDCGVALEPEWRFCIVCGAGVGEV